MAFSERNASCSDCCVGISTFIKITYLGLMQCIVSPIEITIATSFLYGDDDTTEVYVYEIFVHACIHLLCDVRSIECLQVS